MSELELWDLITETMMGNLEQMRADAERAANLSAKSPPGHIHQESWKKVVERAATMGPRYEASVRSRAAERPGA